MKIAEDPNNVHSSTALDRLAELLGTVILVEEVVGDFLQVGQMAVKKGGSDGQEIRVAGVVNLDDAPGILAGSDTAAVNLDDFFGADDSEGHETSELGILLDGVLIILLDVVGKVVDGDPVVLNVLHDQLLGFGQFGGGQGVGTADDGDDVDSGSKALHQFNVELTETRRGSVVSDREREGEESGSPSVPVTSRCDEVKHSVDTVVPEARVTLDTGLLSKNIVILSLEVADNLGKAAAKRKNHLLAGEASHNQAQYKQVQGPS